MSEIICRYPGDRDQAIVSYLYDDEGDFDRAERAAFEAHATTCDRCRMELAAFEGVRASLGRWSPPGLRSEHSPSFGAASPPRLRSENSPSFGEASARGIASHEPPATGSRSWWRDAPVWARTAAALLCLGVGAGVANLDVRYSGDGLRVRTGWLSEPAPAVERRDAAADAPWRTELAALEQRLRGEVRRVSIDAASAAGSTNAAAAGGNADLLRRVRAIVDESERRQQRELALRVGEAVREVSAQRQADLAKIDRNFGAMQSNTGREMLRQRSEMLNYVTVRTASQRGQ